MQDKQIHNTLIIGAGGAGCDIAKTIAQKMQQELLLINTYLPTLDNNNADSKIFLDFSGQNQSQDNLAALLTAEQNTINTALNGKDKIIICAGLGGFAGTNCALILAKMFQQKSLPITVVVTLPMEFESAKYRNIAEQSLTQLQQFTDNILVHDHAKKQSLSQNMNLSLEDYFKQVATQLAAEAANLNG